MRRGLLIVIEGCDRVGKTSQVTLIKEYFETRDLKVEVQKFPDRTTELGTTIDRYLKGQQEVNLRSIHLLFSANRWEAIERVESKLNSGINVIVDRYAYSGVAYTSAKGIDFNWCKSCDRGLLVPDLVLYLDLNPEVSSGREGYGDEVYENLVLQLKVYHQFEKLREASWKIVDASKPKEVVFESIQQYLGAKLGQSELPKLEYKLFER